MIAARVLPNVTGLDKHFDYLVPERFAPLVTIGTIVRVPLHGRRVGGWVTALGEPQVDRDSLKEITGVTGAGPSAELIALAEWAGVRWAARRRHFLVAASPERAVRQLPGRSAHRSRRRAAFGRHHVDPHLGRGSAPAPADRRPAPVRVQRRRARSDAWSWCRRSIRSA